MEDKSLTMENKSDYYYSNNQRIPLEREAAVYAVKFVSGRDPRDGSLSRSAFQLLNERSEHIGSIPNHNLQIYKVNEQDAANQPIAGMAGFDREVGSLKAETAVEYATVAYRQNRDVPATKVDDLMFVTQEFAVQFKPNISRSQIEEINQKYSVTLVKPLDYATNGYVLRAPDADGDRGPVVLSNLYFESGLVLFAHPNFVQRRHTKSVLTKGKPVKVKSALKTPGDHQVEGRSNYLVRQWHLETAKVVDAWKITKGSSEIKVAILDDGVDAGHPEFADKIKIQYDFATGTADAKPKNAGDNHGTACAGVAVARGVKAFGSAPNCSLIAVNTPNFLGSLEEGEMFKWVCDQGADIISCSWGPKDGTGAVDPLPDNVRAAINYCVTHGRKGLGIAIFWAAGNGDESVSNDGYAANPDVFAVAASSNKETRSWYSDYGPEVFICAPSSGDRNAGELGIFTVDRRGDDGYNPDKNTGSSHPADDLNYTDSFGGTSSATPLTAGIAALMLSINPNLTVSDLREILKTSTDQIDTAGGNYDEQGHSDYYGYGRINARLAVENARDFAGGNTPDNSSNTPSITAPGSISRDAAPPAFDIDKGGRKLYAVELAGDAALFNYATHASERTDSNFYASWQQAMLENVPFTLPAEVWGKLKSSERLFYRLQVADDNSWANYAVTTTDEGFAAAPGFDILDSGSSGGGADNDTAPSISAPGSVGRGDSGPTFDIDKGGRKLYAVELASNAELFNYATHGDERTDTNFYASWQDAMLEDLPFVLPAAVWDKLKAADRLFYRMHVADDHSWGNYGVTTADESSAAAPGFNITDQETPAADSGSSRQPSISGADRMSRDDDAPVFEIDKAGRRLYAVEITCRAELFDNDKHGSERTEANFFASWEQGMLSEVPFTMPADAWDRLKPEDQLYYRVHVADDHNWANYGVSVGDEASANAPMMTIDAGSRMMKAEMKSMTGGKRMKPFILVEARAEDEALWKN